ncbi:flagellar hook assembly protein FlgD [Pseudomonas indica]|jgi:flagellar basal-body rod modification protein FlgD|uniref:flagellar hook assembly protein FlgD n=1 Tax=Pseudomonas indica TaxID=137658 RepID=UPI0023F77610|nr:flagellar hook assembly protein FlgD [Pseudomonas indica]MBU3057572.1 flagellar hook assembly protein FlgD [Pseudomonas indica]
MATVNATSQSNAASLDIDAVKNQAVNVSDATQMENNFISLMVAQIKNQDPTKPVDSTEFLNQYAAMSQVKSMENMTALTKSNLVLLDNLQTLTAAGLVGQDVKVAASSLQLDGDSVSGRLTQAHASSKTVLVLTDVNGVKTEIPLGSQEAGAVEFVVDPKALGLAPGKYSIEAKTDSGEYPTVEVAGRVKQVRVSSEGPVLEIEGVGSVPFYNITEFGQTPVAGLL